MGIPGQQGEVSRQPGPPSAWCLIPHQHQGRPSWGRQEATDLTRAQVGAGAQARCPATGIPAGQKQPDRKLKQRGIAPAGGKGPAPPRGVGIGPQAASPSPHVTHHTETDRLGPRLGTLLHTGGCPVLWLALGAVPGPSRALSSPPNVPPADCRAPGPCGAGRDPCGTSWDNTSAAGDEALPPAGRGSKRKGLK